MVAPFPANARPPTKALRKHQVPSITRHRRESGGLQCLGFTKRIMGAGDIDQ